MATRRICRWAGIQCKVMVSSRLVQAEGRDHIGYGSEHDAVIALAVMSGETSLCQSTTQQLTIPPTWLYVLTLCYVLCLSTLGLLYNMAYLTILYLLHATGMSFLLLAVTGAVQVAPKARGKSLPAKSIAQSFALDAHSPAVELYFCALLHRSGSRSSTCPATRHLHVHC